MLYKIPGYNCVVLINILHKTSKLSLRTSNFPFFFFTEGFSPWSCFFIYICIFINGINFKSRMSFSIVKSWYIILCTSEVTFPHWKTILVGLKALPAYRASGNPASVIYMGVIPGTLESKKYSIFQQKTRAVARHSFSMLWPKLRMHCCTLVSCAVSVLLALYPVK